MKFPEKPAITLTDEAATLEFGASLSRLLPPKVNIYLHGALGAGKTTLVRGILRGLGFAGRVKSPTYTLVEVYAISRLNLYHFDFYRLTDPDEWHEAGFRDLLNAEAICLIEWPEKTLDAELTLPISDLAISLVITPQNQRQLTMESNTEVGAAIFNALFSQYGIA